MSPGLIRGSFCSCIYILFTKENGVGFDMKKGDIVTVVVQKVNFPNKGKVKIEENSEDIQHLIGDYPQ